jgi:teichuronic acid biosynthesis glycosyltransferase TuaG
MPLISIVTPVYNAAPLLQQTLHAVRSQTMTDWEWIFVDDCSSDGSGALLERVAEQDNRLRIIRRAETGTRANGFHQAIEAANGRYIAFIEPGDLWLPEKLEMQIGFMQHHRAAISYHAYRRLSLSGSTGRVLRGPARVTYDMLLTRHPMSLSTIVVDRDVIPAISFAEDVEPYEDLPFWLHTTKSGRDILFLNHDLGRDCHPPQSASVVRRVVALWRVARVHAKLRYRQVIRFVLRYALSGLWKRLF